MYILTSLIIHVSIFISLHLVNHNYCIYLHKILIEKTQNIVFDYETFFFGVGGDFLALLIVQLKSATGNRVGVTRSKGTQARS